MEAAADPRKAPAMQAYMKSAMPYYGINLPEINAICRRVFAEHPLASCRAWRSAVREVWRRAVRREERYAAVALLGWKPHGRCLTPEAMPLLEEMIVSGAWWDHVDAIAHFVGVVLREHPQEMKPLMRAWSTDSNLWKRRVSIICQLGFKRETDLELLYANIEPNLADRDFFIRKAIGWALRQYAWADPAEVVRFVHRHEARMSALSRREALKNAGRAPGPRRAKSRESPSASLRS